MKGKSVDEVSGLPFLKIEAAGNDFVLFDFRTQRGPKLSVPLVRFLLDRHRGIGGDGLLVLYKERDGVGVEYRNADGSPADFCGNGARCAASLLLEGEQGPITFQMMKIPVEAVRTETGIAVRVGAVEVRDMPELSRLRPRPAALIRAGVDHWIVPVGDVNALDVVGLGQGLRHHPWPGPKGANVTFVERRRSEIRIRTYERGVEGETLSCGSGCVAAAHWALSGERGPLPVLTEGGDILRVWRDASDCYWLEGPTRICFTGLWPVEAKVAAAAAEARAGAKKG
ncbi:MAG: diaminopimelate epimerase [Candidatus Eisenbacteria bacterium]|nr:diaminopimelate epimerase [Candidatus Eisenbacteria bacterium]